MWVKATWTGPREKPPRETNSQGERSQVVHPLAISHHPSNHPAASSHPLFGVLDYIAKNVNSRAVEIDCIKKKMSKLEDGLTDIGEIQKELKFLIEKTSKIFN